MRTARRKLILFSPAVLLLLPGIVYAHERFIRHDLKFPLHEAYFGRHPEAFLGIQTDMMRIGTISFVLLAVFLITFFFREDLDIFIEHRVLSGLRGPMQRALNHLANFLTDKPVRLRWFHTLGEWAVILFLRSPALVLMYSATNDSLVMPSYPLEPTSALFFKFFQVFLAILILTQTALPLAGALVIGTWIYLWRWGWMVAADAIPVVTVAVLYITAPWQSHKLAITEMNETQVRWVRLILGFGFFALGWLKIYNYHLTAGVADNYPSVMNDPMIGFFAMGTNPLFRRENWIVAFALAEVLSGFMFMVGVFTRVWGSLMLWIFIKLMLVNFGWEEIPHIYPIAATLAVVCSNKVQSEFGIIETLQRKAGREGRTVFRVAAVLLASVAIAALTIYTLLFALSFVNRSNL
ncbi:MAG TPA: hypothetical protein VI216_00180 [Candidatus Acidoferrales bacterium]